MLVALYQHAFSCFAAELACLSAGGSVLGTCGPEPLHNGLCALGIALLRQAYSLSVCRINLPFSQDFECNFFYNLSVLCALLGQTVPRQVVHRQPRAFCLLAISAVRSPLFCLCCDCSALAVRFILSITKGAF